MLLFNLFSNQILLVPICSTCSGGIVSFFVCEYLTWGPVTWGWPWPRPSLQSHFRLCIKTLWLTVIGKKKAPSHYSWSSLEIHGTERRAEVSHACLFIFLNMDRTSAQPQVKLSLYSAINLWNSSFWSYYVVQSLVNVFELKNCPR